MPVLGSPNTVTANAPVPRPATQPCTVTLFHNFDFSDFNPKPFNYTPPADCPGPWAAVVFEADWSVDPGVQYDRTANIWIGGSEHLLRHHGRALAELSCAPGTRKAI